MDENTVHLGARVPPELSKAVRKAAIEADCTLGEYLIRVLMADEGVRRELSRQKKKKEK